MAHGGSGSRDTEATYFFLLGNLPPQWDWRNLKDFVQRSSKIGWADVFSDSGLSGQSGWFRMQLRHGPLKVFDMLRDQTVDGRRLSVIYFDTSGEQSICRGSNFIDVSCSQRHMPSLPSKILETKPWLVHATFAKSQFVYSPATPPPPHIFQAPPSHPYQSSTAQLSPPQMYRSTHQPHPNSYPTIIPPTIYPPAPLIGSSNDLASNMANMQLSGGPQYNAPAGPGRRNPRNTARQPNPVRQPNSVRQLNTVRQPNTVYHPGPTGPVDTGPVDTTSAVVTTDTTNIHITGLSFYTTESRLTEHLRSVGRPQSVRIRSFGGPARKSKGTAMATYGSFDEAAEAVKMLDHKMLDNRRIRVKLDSNQDVRVLAIAGDAAGARAPRSAMPRPPAVVDGSVGVQGQSEGGG